ncbi:hypothetical protein BDQ17DRAFT_1418479 [Cyathus striatus]|nr:hypothetical protein BDQ17DRAFT_1418479 [Cyathus striatus]
MVNIGSIHISPALINTSCAWSSDLQQLQDLYDSPYTGAVTTRTATTAGYRENDSNTVTFATESLTTLNSFGYSPYSLAIYLEWIEQVLTSSKNSTNTKPFIVSITASDPNTLQSMVASIQELRRKLGDIPDSQTRMHSSRIAIELNTSCPNIPNASPSGYVFGTLLPMLKVFMEEHAKDNSLTIGLKLPPFVYKEQFTAVLDVIDSISYMGESTGCPISFFTCTNTLGNSLLFSEQGDPVDDRAQFALPTVVGGLAGDLLHPLALGNVYTFNQLLQNHKKLKNIVIIGAGGVTSKEAAKRMRKAGAAVVGCATLFGRMGICAFEALGTT